MRDPTRIPRLLDLLTTFWRANPDLRLGQIVDSATGNRDVFYTEDEVIGAWLREQTLERLMPLKTPTVASDGR